MQELSAEVITAVNNNNVNELKEFQESGFSLSGLDKDGDTLLLRAVKTRNTEVFDYLLGVGITNVLDLRERTPLIATLQEPDSEEFSLKLIKSDCDINLTDRDNYSALHYAIYYRYIDVSEALIENGADVNWQNNLGKTPLYIACETRLVDEVFMLLFYGADPTIMTIWGDNSIDNLALHQNEKVRDFFFKNLYPHYQTVILSTIIYAMEYRLFTCSRLLESTVDISYNWDDLEEFSEKFPFQSECFRVFVKKFNYIMLEVIENFSLTQIFSCLDDTIHHIGNYVENLYIILESDLAPRLVEKIKKQNFPAIAYVIQSFYQHRERVDTITELICCLLSRGIDPTTEEINTVYLKYGYCDLFRIMLHMDIVETEDNLSKHVMPLLIYRVDMTIEKYLEECEEKPAPFINSNSLYDVFDFFSNYRLKKIGLSQNNKRISARIAELPVVPSLVELARDGARLHIINAFQIKNSRQFYTILNHLPIAKVHKQIIAFEKKLYPLQQ